MTYNKNKYQCTHLLQDTWYRMGQLQNWVATGGTATTLINTAWAGVEEQIYDDDDPALIFGSVVVIRDAGGAGAAPEGEIGRITDYDAASQTVTLDAISSAIAAADRVGIASPLFPYEDIRELANIALRKLGKIQLVDTSLSIIASKTEYTLPIKVNPIRVRKQTVINSVNNQWEEVPNWSVIPATAGAFPVLVIPHLTQGYKLELLYEDLHPELTAFDTDIHESIEPELALNALLAECYQWYNNKLGGANEYMLQRENKVIQDLEAARARYPIRRIVEQVKGLPHWGTRGEYVPLTSDQRF